jgi:hypothetical protein
MAASVEVSIIAAEFLGNMQCLTNSQFAFCLFICGRMLLAHALYYDIALPNEFDSLVNSLQIMANRWNGEHSTSRSNLASKFAARLNHARQVELQTLDIRQAAYSDNPSGFGEESADVSSRAMDAFQDAADTNRHPLGTFGEILPVAVDQGETPDSITLAFPPLPLAFQAQSSSKNDTAMPSPNLDRLNDASFGQPKSSDANGGLRITTWDVQRWQCTFGFILISRLLLSSR